MCVAHDGLLPPCLCVCVAHNGLLPPCVCVCVAHDGLLPPCVCVCVAHDGLLPPCVCVCVAHDGLLPPCVCVCVAHDGLLPPCVCVQRKGSEVSLMTSLDHTLYIPLVEGNAYTTATLYTFIMKVLSPLTHTHTSLSLFAASQLLA